MIIWEKKSPEEQDFQAFYRAVHAAAHSSGSRFKTRAKLLKQMVSSNRNMRIIQEAVGNGEQVQERVEGSKTCVIQ